MTRPESGGSTLIRRAGRIGLDNKANAAPDHAGMSRSATEAAIASRLRDRGFLRHRDLLAGADDRLRSSRRRLARGRRKSRAEWPGSDRPPRPGARATSYEDDDIAAPPGRLAGSTPTSPGVCSGTSTRRREIAALGFRIDEHRSRPTAFCGRARARTARSGARQCGENVNHQRRSTRRPPAAIGWLTAGGARARKGIAPMRRGDAGRRLPAGYGFGRHRERRYRQHRGRRRRGELDQRADRAAGRPVRLSPAGAHSFPVRTARHRRPRPPRPMPAPAPRPNRLSRCWLKGLKTSWIASATSAKRDPNLVFAPEPAHPIRLRLGPRPASFDAGWPLIAPDHGRVRGSGHGISRGSSGRSGGGRPR